MAGVAVIRPVRQGFFRTISMCVSIDGRGLQMAVLSKLLLFKAWYAEGRMIMLPFSGICRVVLPKAEIEM